MKNLICNLKPVLYSKEGPSTQDDAALSHKWPSAVCYGNLVTIQIKYPQLAAAVLAILTYQ